MRKSRGCESVGGNRNADPAQRLRKSFRLECRGTVARSGSCRRGRAKRSSALLRGTSLGQRSLQFADRDAHEALLSIPDPLERDARRSAIVSAGNRTIAGRPYSCLFELHYARDGAGDAVPVGGLFFKVLPPEWREGIKLRATVIFTRLPLRSNPASMFELVQGGIEGTIADAQDVAGNLFQALADRPAVHRPQGEDFQEQHVERPLNQVGRLAHELSSRLPS